MEGEAALDVLIVGAGFAGCTIARCCADAGKRVLVIDRRDHIGGNAHDHHDKQGVLVHRYGPHIFHTNSEQVVAFLSRFTDWRDYEHRVLSRHEGTCYPMPINRSTLERFFGVDLPDDDAASELLNKLAEDIDPIRNSADVVRSQVGTRLYEAFFRGYTRKQWRRDPSELDRSICARIPVRSNLDDRYFTDRFQKMPAQGYTALFKRMLDHPLLQVETGRAYQTDDRKLAKQLVWTGPIDHFYEQRFGALGYRSLRFEHQHLPDTEQFQEVGTINEASPTVPYTRTTEFKHLSGQSHSGTSIVREFPPEHDGGDPYYPIIDDANKSRYRRYAELAQKEQNVLFIGRLAQFKYYNMDQVIAAALTAADAFLNSDA
jgi:UDP-galactopyranose mutase